MGIIIDREQASAVVVVSAFCESNRVLFNRMELAEVEPSDIDIFPVILLGDNRGPAEERRVIVLSLEDRWLHDKILGHYHFEKTREGIKFTRLVKEEDQSKDGQD